MTPTIPKLSRFARPLFLSLSAAAFVAIFIVGAPVLLPFFLAVVVAYVLFPAVQVLERTRLPRWGAILVVYAITIGVMTAFGWATIPRFFAETRQLSAELPKVLARGRDEWLPAVDRKLAQWSGVKLVDHKPADSAAPVAEEPPPIVIVPREDGAYEVRVRDDLRFVPQHDGSWTIRQAKPEGQRFSSARAFDDAFNKAIAFAQHNSGELLKLARGVVAGVARGVFYLFMTLMLAGYMMYTYERIIAFFRQLWPEKRRASFDRFLVRVDRGLAGVVRGQLLICLVNGVLSAIGFWLFDLKYWPILSLIAAALSIIPIFGSILSSIPAVAIGLTQGLGTALGVLAWIVGIHQLEANFLNPKIIGDAAKIHPVLVVFALLVGEHFYQITGALLAVPCLALVQAVFVHFRESILGIPGPHMKGQPAPAAAAAGQSSVAPIAVGSVTGPPRAGPTGRVGLAEAPDDSAASPDRSATGGAGGGEELTSSEVETTRPRTSAEDDADTVAAPPLPGGEQLDTLEVRFSAADMPDESADEAEPEPSEPEPSDRSDR